MAVVRARRGEQFEPVERPVLPFLLWDAWEVFVDLSGARQAAFSLQPIQWSEIAAYQAVTDTRLTPFEIRMIRRLDDEYLRIVAAPEPRP